MTGSHTNGPGALEQVVAGLAADHEAGRAPGSAVCAACAAVVGATGAGIMFKIGENHHGSLGCSDEHSALIEELQFTLGEGPCVDAHRSGRPVAEPDLANPATPRWPVFSPVAADAGVRAVFAFPLKLGAARLGALDLHCDRPGDLRGDQRSHALAIADVVAHAVLDLQGAAPPGVLAPGLAGAETLRIEVHQASGMISSRLDISVTDALIRLRARAYAEGRPINDVARDMIARRLRIE